MISPGNSKLGSLVHSFSLPDGDTCPGKTELCAKHCYAAKGYFRYASVKKMYEDNLAKSRTSSFVKDMIEEIKSKKIRVLRIHASGDFYDAKYVRKWIKIASRCKDVVFYVYTRSWRVSRMLAALRDLNRLRNVRLWWSVDKETVDYNGRPPRWRGARVAYMQVDDKETIPAYADLVFRVKRTTIHKYADGKLICPVEQGTGANITCTSCKLCFSGRAIPQKLYVLTN